MAIPTLVSFSIADSDGDSGTMAVFVQNNLTIAQYADFVSEFAPILDAVTGGKLTGASVTLGLTLPEGLKEAFDANIENQKGALFSFDSGARYKYGLRVPAFKPALFSGKNVNLEGAGVPAFINAITAGVAVTGSGTVVFRDGYDNSPLVLMSATKSHRRK